MSGSQKITWRVIGAAVVVAVILLATGWAYKERLRAAAVSVQPPRVDMPPTDAPSRRLSNTVATHMPSVGRAIGVDECGISRAPSTATHDGEGDGWLIEASAKTHDRWEAALLDSSDSHSRAVGLMMHGVELARAGLSVQAGESLDELVQLAAGAGDPALYALAVGQCRKQPSDASPSGACQRISLSEWARIDPDNAVPWLLIAQAAENKNDGQAEATAFARATEAHKIDNYSDSLLSFGLPELPRDITPAEKMSLGIQLIGYEAAWAVPEFREILRYCSEAALRRDETHAECDAVAELLVSRGNTFFTLSVGARLGARVGWSPERVKRLSQESDELLALASQPPGDSCEAIHRVNAFFDNRAQVGELEALRALRDRPEQQFFQ